MSAEPGYLIDTHVLLWLDSQPERVASSVTNLIRDPETRVYVSSASLWEVAIKVSQKKLRIEAIGELASRRGFLELPVIGRYAGTIAQLPFHHKDPFDRMLIAQAQVESLILITNDPLMLPYDVPIISV